MTPTALHAPHPLAALLIGLLTMTMTSGTAHAQEPPPRDDLVVTRGEGLVRRAPDRAFVTIAAESRARQPKPAQQANATAMTAVLEKLRALGLTDETIRTLAIGVEPEYDWTDGKQSLRGYVARNVIEVRLDDIARVGEVVDAAVGSGATQVRNVRFTLKDMAGAEREALRLAAADARARAEALASGVSRGVARIIRLDEVGEVRPEPMMARMAAAPMMADPAPQTPVAAGEIEVRATVTLTAVMK